MEQLTLDQAFRKLKKQFPKQTVKVGIEYWRFTCASASDAEETDYHISVFSKNEPMECRVYAGPNLTELVKRVIEEGNNYV